MGDAFGIFPNLYKALDFLDREIFLTWLLWFSKHLTEIIFIVAGKLQSASRLNSSTYLIHFMYKNDIIKATNDVKFIIYSDDTNIFLSDSSLNSLVSRSNEALGAIKMWISRNRLTLNECKTQYTVYHMSESSNLVINSLILIDDKVINMMSETKFLGVYTDENVCWYCHISHMCLILSKYISTFLKIKDKIFRKKLLII